MSVTESLVSIFVYPLLIWFARTIKYIELLLMKVFNTKVETVIQQIFKKKAGVTINGTEKWDIRVKNPNFYRRLACDGTLGTGESYMDGWWDCDAVDEFSYRLFKAGLYKDRKYSTNRLFNKLLLRGFNLQTKARAFEVGIKHYDQGNELFESFLDSSMNYSCGYWKNATNLEEAQQHKMELIAQKLCLKPGMRVLDIGCGWGGLCKYLAQNYKVQVVGITISVEGAKIGQERCKDLPVDIRVTDYRDLDEKFDRIVSVGMFEHVGQANYRTFFEVTNRCLENNGILLLHTIGVSHKDVPLTEPWFHTYIFPNGILPYYKDIPETIEGLFILEDWHNFGYDYSKTLMAWHEKFVKAWPKLSYKGERFFRMWKFYLLMSAGAFRARKYQLWQIVLTKNGYEGGYQAAR